MPQLNLIEQNNSIQKDQQIWNAKGKIQFTLDTSL